METPESTSKPEPTVEFLLHSEPIPEKKYDFYFIFNQLYEIADLQVCKHLSLNHTIDRIEAEGQAAIVDTCRWHEEQVYRCMMEIDLLESDFRPYFQEHLYAIFWPLFKVEDDEETPKPETDFGDEDEDEGNEEIYTGFCYDLGPEFFDALYETVLLKLGPSAKEQLVSSLPPKEKVKAYNRAVTNLENKILTELAEAFPKSVYAIALRNVLRERIRAVCVYRTGNASAYDNIPLPYIPITDDQ